MFPQYIIFCKYLSSGQKRVDLDSYVNAHEERVQQS